LPELRWIHSQSLNAVVFNHIHFLVSPLRAIDPPFGLYKT
jgi:hypothetical protein